MKVVIIGASVAGSATALALARAGHDVQLFERGETAETGAGFVLWPNATFVLDRLQILDAIGELSARPAAMTRFDLAGQALGGWDLLALERKMGYPSLSILRSDLLRILHRALRRQGVEVQTGCRAIELLDSPGVQFEGGRTITADLVVGADGRRHSVTRRYVRPEHAAIYQGFVNWVGVSPVRLSRPIVHDYAAAERRFGIVPVAGEKVYWAGAMRRDSAPAPNETLSRAELLELFTGWPPVVREVIERSEKGAFKTIGIYDVEPNLAWHRGNVLLIGDAAHAACPTSGQGVSQALEDAWHLRDCLPKRATRVSDALTEFTRLRFEKTRAITQSGRALARELFRPQSAGAAAHRPSGAALDLASLASFWGAGLPLQKSGSTP
ncbi:MAG TPA: FAD-dependent monooxygenase [Polyangiaceae bacterium]|nr:FAD-dependent monooxygenase [Polyangiaceae bacterium]